MLEKLLLDFGVFVSNISSRLREMQVTDIQEGVFDGHIYVSKNEVRLKTPFIVGGRINFPETFLNFLWSVCFYLCTTTEELVDQEKRPDFHGELEPRGFVLNARDMINWGLNLRFFNLPWPDQVCDPYADNENHNFVRLVFKHALAFILFHEYAHAKLGHVVDVDDGTSVAQETEADNFALQTVYGELPDDDAKLLYVLGVICAGICMLYSITDPANIKQTTHPDIDVRLLHYLEFFELPESNERRYIHRLLTVGLRGFIETYKLPIDQSRSFDDTWQHVLYLVDIIEAAKTGT